MKRIITISACLFILTPAMAQKAKQLATKIKEVPAAKKPGVIYGTIKNLHGEPIQDVEAFVYKMDTIKASGFTNDTGFFETGMVKPGNYGLKLKYPNDKTIMITGVQVKADVKTGIVINVSTDAPTADSTISYSTVAPKPKLDKNKKR